MTGARRGGERHGLLSGDEERELGRAIHAGRTALESLEALGESARDAELEALVEAGEAARDRFIEANVRLVWHLANRHAAKTGRRSDDVASDGTLGLIAAVERFDPELGFRFSTYATWWIRRAIEAGDRSDDPWNVPREARRRSDVIVIPERPASLDVDAEDGTSLAERIPGGDPVPGDALAGRDATGVGQALTEIAGPELAVIVARFGLGSDGTPRTLGDVANQLGWTRTRVARVEALALAKLRSSFGPGAT